MEKFKLKDIYEKVNHNPYCQITNILKKFELKSNFKNLLKNYGKIILLVAIILIGALIFVFWNNIEIILCSIGILMVLFILAIIYNTYKISLDENNLKFKINMQTTNISYEKLINIYLDKKSVRLFFIPIPYYKINIVYVSDNDKVNILAFPTIMLNKKDVYDLFSCFEVKEYKIPNDKIKKHK